MKHLGLSVLVMLSVFLTGGGVAFSQKMKAEDVLAKHLEAIGTAQKRLLLKSQITVGDAVVNFVSPKTPSAQGRIVLASAGEKNFWGLSTNRPEYPSEKFSFDGNKTQVGFVQLGTRSVLGNFILSNKMILEEGLLGGTLSSSWALLDMTSKRAKLSFEGTKKIDGKEAYVLGYSAKGGGDVNVNLYFDKETFNHVRTEYRRTSSASIGSRPEDSSRNIETRLRVTEDFSEFKPENGLNLPHNYRLMYSVEGQRGTTEIEWLFKLTNFAFNQNLAADTFTVDAN